MYDANGKITREGAVQVIQRGESVSITDSILDAEGKPQQRTRLFSSLENLPGEAEFARGDANAEATAKARLQKTIADAQAQLKSLESAKVAKQ